MNDVSRKFQRDLNAGLVGFVLLGVLESSEGDLYGYDIAKRLQQGRDAEPVFKEGRLYPVLRALAAKGWLASRIVPSYSGPPRRYYRITETGRAVLADWRAVWSDTRDFVERFAARAVDSPRGAT